MYGLVYKSTRQVVISVGENILTCHKAVKIKSQHDLAQGCLSLL